MKNKGISSLSNILIIFACLSLFSFTIANNLPANKSGISVTLEVGIPELVAGLVNDPRDETFKPPFNLAIDRSKADEGNFIDLFGAEFEHQNDSVSLTKHFYYYDREGITRKSSNVEVLKWLKNQAAKALNETGQLMVKRALQYGLSKPKISYHYALNQLTIELPGIIDNQFVRKSIQANGGLGFYEVYENKYHGISGLILQGESELGDTIYGIDNNSTDPQNVSSDYLMSPESREKEYPITSLLNLAFKFDELEQIVDYQEGSIIGYAKIKDTSALNALLNHPTMRKNLPHDLEFMWDYKEILENGQLTGTVAVHAIKVPLDGPKVNDRDIQKATVDDHQTGMFGVNLVMNKIGARKWKKMTAENLNNQIAMVVNNAVISAPVVIGIMEESSSITGNFTLKEAKDLTDLINAGSFPAPVVIISVEKL